MNEWYKAFINNMHLCFTNDLILLEAYKEFEEKYGLMRSFIKPQSPCSFQSVKEIHTLIYAQRGAPASNEFWNQSFWEALLIKPFPHTNDFFDGRSFFVDDLILNPLEYRVVIEYAYVHATDSIKGYYKPNLVVDSKLVDSKKELKELLSHFPAQYIAEQRSFAYAGKNLTAITRDRERLKLLKCGYSTILEIILNAKQNGLIRPDDLKVLNEILNNVESINHSLAAYNLSHKAALFLRIDSLNPKLAEYIGKKVNESIKNNLHYQHARSDGKSRIHIHQANYSFFKRIPGYFNEALSAQLDNLHGDSLKSAIIAEFKKSIEPLDSVDIIEQKAQMFKQSKEYKILARGQGICTKLFGLKTSSIEAIEKIIADTKINMNTFRSNEL